MKHPHQGYYGEDDNIEAPTEPAPLSIQLNSEQRELLQAIIDYDKLHDDTAGYQTESDHISNILTDALRDTVNNL